MADLIATSTVYVLPRISADGAEYIMTTPYSCRSSPVLLDPSYLPPGFVADDVDGNGECVLMRQRDPSGTVKISEMDPRIMVTRGPQERELEGEFYRCASPALSPLPLIFSYESEKSLCGAAYIRRVYFGSTTASRRPPPRRSLLI